MARCARYRSQALAATRGLSVLIFELKARTLLLTPHAQPGGCSASRPGWVCRRNAWRTASASRATGFAPVQPSQRSGSRARGEDGPTAALCTQSRPPPALHAPGLSNAPASAQRPCPGPWHTATRPSGITARPPRRPSNLERRHSWRERSRIPRAFLGSDQQPADDVNLYTSPGGRKRNLRYSSHCIFQTLSDTGDVSSPDGACPYAHVRMHSQVLWIPQSIREHSCPCAVSRLYSDPSI